MNLFQVVNIDANVDRDIFNFDVAVVVYDVVVVAVVVVVDVVASKSSEKSNYGSEPLSPSG